MSMTTKNGAAVGKCPEGQASLVPHISVWEMDRALSDAEFSLVYQPMINLHAGRITSCEALLRWNHPLSGVILPGEFVSFVEQFGFMPCLGRWVLQTALAEAATWPGGTR